MFRLHLRCYCAAVILFSCLLPRLSFRKVLILEASVERATIDLPKVYADHHVEAARKALLHVAGVRAAKLAGKASNNAENYGFFVASLQNYA